MSTHLWQPKDRPEFESPFDRHVPTAHIRILIKHSYYRVLVPERGKGKGNKKAISVRLFVLIHQIRHGAQTQSHCTEIMCISSR